MASSTVDSAHAPGHGSGHAPEDHDDGAVHAHIAPLMFYVAVFGALIALTGITVAVSYFDFGEANTVIALVVATLKASLVAAFFMHLTHDKLFNTVMLLSAFLFLSIFFLLTNEDSSHRNQVDSVNGAHVLPSTGEAAPGGMPVVKSSAKE